MEKEYRVQDESNPKIWTIELHACSIDNFGKGYMVYWNSVFQRKNMQKCRFKENSTMD